MAGLIFIATRTEETLKRAEELNLGGHYTTDPKEGSRGRPHRPLSPGRLLQRRGRTIYRRLRMALSTDADSSKASVLTGVHFHSRPSFGRHRKVRAGRPLARCDLLAQWPLIWNGSGSGPRMARATCESGPALCASQAL
ncbi:hypothetical protein MPLB_1490092 [Mesorhizobium sp. ORS 3324]|nr:hypothetical protein MPLB_1490092 [Mesorhizobium sp. ORS 3324]